MVNERTKSKLDQQSGIYEMKWINCGWFYIWKTSRYIETWFKKHERTKPHSALGSHFENSKHEVYHHNMKILQKKIIINQFYWKKSFLNYKNNPFILNDKFEFDGRNIFELMNNWK